MTNTETLTKKEQQTVPTMDNKKGIENHKTIATHLETAANLHKEAARHHEAGNHEKAAECVIKAQGHTCIANDAQREDAKHHALAK